VAFRLVLLLILAAAGFCTVSAEAHDPSAWGGLFRSRDQGARWLPVNEGRFIGGAIALAISPTDPHHLLLGTDSGLLRSRNGGRDWLTEAPATLVGAVFAVAFGADGVDALASTGQTLYGTEDGVDWKRSALSRDALPARAIAMVAPRRAYVAGANGVWRTDDAGASWVAQSDGLPEGSVGGLLVAPGSPVTIWAVAGGRLWRRPADAGYWEAGDRGMPEGRVDAAAADPADPARLWAAAADQIYRSDDAGRNWAPVGQPLPEANTSVRGLAVLLPAIVLTTHRGLYRSADGGRTWALQEGMLPIHLEAGPLVRDPSEPVTLYAGFALTPYDQAWRTAERGGAAFRRLDTASLAGGAALLLAVFLSAIAVLRRLGRHYGRRAPAVTSPTAERAH